MSVSFSALWANHPVIEELMNLAPQTELQTLKINVQSA